MQAFLRTMTPTERAKFREYALNDVEKLKTKTPTVLLSRETSPHTNQTFMVVPPSRETGPHHSQALEKLVKVLRHCEECNGEHLTCTCVKRFQRLRKPESTPYLAHDDDSTGSSTLYDSERSEDGKTRLTIDPSTCPTKSVSFSLLEDRSTTPEPESPSYNADESENDEADARLTHVAQLRKLSDNIYMSNRKSMSLKAYVHATHRRTEAPALLDLGATENFMSLTYAKWLNLSFKCLPHERPLLNVDGVTGSRDRVWLHLVDRGKFWELAQGLAYLLF